MSNEQMTDELRALDLIYHEVGDTKEARDAYEFLSARLRGESEQPAAVAGDAVRMREAIQRFVDREEAGEVHSKHVYTEFKEILSAAPAAPGHHFRVLLAEARREYRDTDAAGDVLAWLDERVLDVDHAASVAVPDGLINRVEEAARRVDNGHALRRIPADPTDVDLVLGEVLAWLKGEPAPFWVPAAAPVAPEREG